MNLQRVNDLRAALAEKDLSYFIKQAWKVLEPETVLKWNWHHSYLCEHLEAVELGQIRRLILNIGPRSLKSLLATVCFPAKVWTNQPSSRWLFGSHADTLATKHSILRRNLIESDWYQNNWSDRFKLAGDLNMKTEFANNKTGQMKSAGILSSITGEGCDYQLIDDPHNPKSAESDKERESTIMNFDLAWSTRLNDKKTGRIIVIMQRLHDQDLTGHLLAKNAGYVHVKIPTIAEDKERLVFPISKKIKERNPGDLIHPDRDGPTEIEQMKKDLGSYGFSGQHQQNPTPRKGGIVQRDWFQYWHKLPDRFDIIIQSWDTSFKDTTTSDYVVGTAWGKKGGQFYLLDLVRDQMGFTACINAITSFSAKHPRALTKLIEDKANGPAIIDVLKTKIPGLIPVSPDSSKAARFAAVSPLFEAKNVFVPHPSIAPWVHDYIDELCKFPKGKDDQVDATSQALGRLEGKMAGITDSMMGGRRTSQIDFSGS